MVAAEGWEESKFHSCPLEHHLQSSLAPGLPEIHTQSTLPRCPAPLQQEKQEGWGKRAKGLETLDSRTIIAPCRARNGPHVAYPIWDCSLYFFFLFLFLALDREVGAKKVSIWFDWNCMRLEKIQLLWPNVWQIKACMCELVKLFH